MPLLSTSPALASFCDTIAASPILFLDTEFVRERTYYPQLCLIQVAGAEGEVKAVDTLAADLDLSPLLTLLANPNTIKVFHAARQDLEIFYYLTGSTMANVFDTQVAAAALGYGDSIGYEPLVERVLKRTLNKSARGSDWSRRPLSEAQLSYALDDVRYLREAYHVLQEKLLQKNRLAWIAPELELLSDPLLYAPHPEDAWKRLASGRLKPKQLAILREAAKWREIEARRRNVPRGRVVQDDLLMELAQLMPHSLEDLNHSRRFQNVSPNTKEALLAATQAALSLPPESWPQMPARSREEGVNAALSMLDMLLDVCCDEHQIAKWLVATKDDLRALLAGKPSRLDDGWRAEIFGAKARAFLEGNGVLRFDPTTRRIVLELQAQ